ncbi:MAG: hypothetical protein EOM40_17570 [Clostridia bacterium]|nr:hypothetical protein [Clostridia bacterium]NCC43289.1 hypothetical protein [Clostridia bacterium]
MEQSTLKMKCKYCGAVISLTDERCPYCGNINELAKEHIAEKKKYEKDLEETGSVVKKQSKASLEILVRAGILVTLILVFFLLIFLMIHIERDAYEGRHKEAIKNQDEITETMLEYWADGRYYEFYAYCDSYELTGWTAGPFLKYYPEMQTARCYMFINRHIAKYLAEDEIYKKNEELESVCGLLDEIYDMESYSYEARGVIDPEENERLLSQIYDSMDDVLQTYFGLHEEDFRERATMDEDEWQILIEDRLEEKG